MSYEESKNNELSILVYSCWKNSDMWQIFMQLFHKYWSDCVFKIILLTDMVDNAQDKYGFDDIVVFDGTWNDMVNAGIHAANTEYVMLWMDDYLLCDFVKNEDIFVYLGAARKYNAANIRLVESAFIIERTFAKDDKFNCHKAGTAYSFSLQVGIWNVDILKKYIHNYKSPWDFERQGSIEIKDDKHPLLTPKNYAFPYEEGVRRGKWMDNGVRLCKRNNIVLDFSKRKQMSSFEMAWIYFKGGVLEMNPTLVTQMQRVWNYLVHGRDRKHLTLFILYSKVWVHRIVECISSKKYKGTGKPAPAALKRKLVADYARDYGCNVLVETGTYLGEMVEHQANSFEKIFSIEIADVFYKFSSKRLRKYKNITIIKGDSGVVLRGVCKQVFPDDRILFWLDGHYSGGQTGRGEKDCPIYEELASVFETREGKDVILIDDARCFNGKGDYPTISELSAFVEGKSAAARIETKNDIIRILLTVDE